MVPEITAVTSVGRAVMRGRSSVDPAGASVFGGLGCSRSVYLHNGSNHGGAGQKWTVPP
jgi:hypothetical protein